MFLSIDVGNSNMVFGFYDPEQDRWTHQLRLPTRGDMVLTWLEKNIRLYMLENDLKASQVKAVGISCVVPVITKPLIKFVEAFFDKPVHLVHVKSQSQIRVNTKNPTEIGTDLLANAEAAFQIYQGPCIIVDFGTALTFSVINKKGELLGVNIVPGLETAIKSLFMHTAKLPEVKLELPSSAIGKDTVHAIQAGILYGFAGLVRGMLSSIRAEIPLEFKVIATGGLSAILTQLKEEFDVIDKELTLNGIKLIAEKNFKNNKA
ncbi:type III pantothenate kinase [Echinicola jeungdonensis]|uniref:Type III pantothenate kinase n=1 Tax=Echinicola jeungdonensis TaxID=709343 RepID=A0ABV5J6P0_9BACT|nr:type III pantothenate kinase [Echinicola jeungdonensis]MDN3669244.1 type III pantothenate kinase [Echinicola jeungdonensis]